MGIEQELKVNCDECGKQDNYCDVHCEDCLIKIVDNCFEEAMREASKKDYLWNDREHYTGWETEKEKDIYLKGLKHGFFDALFQIAYYRGDDLVRIWEEIEEKSK